MVMKMFNQAIVIFLKEMKCLIRDKKTFWISILLPFILVPLMLFITDYSIKGMQGETVNNVDVGVSSKDNSFYNFLSSQSNITVIDSGNPKKDLDSGKISAYIYLDEDIDKKVLNKQSFEIKIESNDASMNSVIAGPILNQYESMYREIVNNYVFDSEEDLKSKLCIPIDISNAEDFKFDISSMCFNLLLPMMLIIYCCIGSSGTASELSAGEKERGTLEPLLSTGVDRSAVVLGKLLATTCMGFISGLFTVLGLYAYLFTASGNKKMTSLTSALLLLVFIILVSMFFAAINLAIGVYSRSFKESQTYLTPVMLISILPAFFTYTLDINSIKFLHLSIPIFNVLCIIKEILAGCVNLVHVAVVTFWLIVYIFVSCYLIFKLFKRENVIFRV